MARPNVVAFPAPPRPAQVGSERGLHVARLTVSDFRCYQRATIEADHRPVVLSGPNGAGKTNLLEALSFLAPGRGLRQARLAEIDRRSHAADRSEPPGPWAVAARLIDAAGECDIGTGRDPAIEETARDRRLVRINGASQRGQTGLAERLAVLWLTPQMDGLFTESKSARRRFLDRLVFCFDPGHASRLNACDQAMSERLRLLRGEAPGGGSAGIAVWLDALEQQIAEHGIAISAARLDLVSRLGRVLAETDGAFPRPALALVGEVEDWLADMPALAAEERLRERLAAGRGLDADAGRALVGPQRSDLQAVFAGSGMPAADCSTGEQKALLIAILLGQARLMADERGRAPLLLLDEVAAHLDEGRRRALFETLLELGVQAWLTGTDRGLFTGFGDRAQFFAVADAHITRN
jgi:DNA replication and repair protein RecF